jgi:hypothetical protein
MSNHLMRAGIGDGQFLIDFFEILFSSMGDDQLIDPSEDVVKCPMVISQLEVGFIEEFLGQHGAGIMSHLRPPVAIKDCKEMHILL